VSISDFLNRTATISRFTVVDDDYSDDADRTYANLIVGMSVRIRKLNASEAEAYLKRNVKATHRMYYLPQTEAVQEVDRVDSEGKTFDIVHVDDWNFQNIYFMVDMVEITWE